jgi:hypothetical protein
MNVNSDCGCPQHSISRKAWYCQLPTVLPTIIFTGILAHGGTGTAVLSKQCQSFTPSAVFSGLQVIVL